MPPTKLKLFLSYLTLHTEKWTDCISPFYCLYPSICPFINPFIHISICPVVCSYITLYTPDLIIYYIFLFPSSFFHLPIIYPSHYLFFFSVFPLYTDEWAYSFYRSFPSLSFYTFIHLLTHQCFISRLRLLKCFHPLTMALWNKHF